MLFKNREEAGRKLAEALEKYKGLKNVVVVALPRGGVVLGRVVADALGAPLDLVVPRKIGAPFNEEYAIGALAESGEAVWNEEERARCDAAALREIVAKERKEADRRLSLYRQGLPPRDLKGKMVLLVDDGVATGYTMRAAINTVKSEQPEKIVVAVPVGPKDTLGELKNEADDVVILHTPVLFFAIGNFYEEFPQVDDATVIALMKKKPV